MKLLLLHSNGCLGQLGSAILALLGLYCLPAQGSGSRRGVPSIMAQQGCGTFLSTESMLRISFIVLLLSAGRELTDREKVTAQIISNWFANKRKELKKLAREGNCFQTDLEEISFSINLLCFQCSFITVVVSMESQYGLVFFFAYHIFWTISHSFTRQLRVVTYIKGATPNIRCLIPICSSLHLSVYCL